MLEATVNRDPLLKALQAGRQVLPFPPEFDVRTFERAYSPGETITHRVNVRRYASQKRASMAAHASQATGGDSDRTLGVMLKVPGPLYRLIFGTEWYVRRDVPPGSRLRHPFDNAPKDESPVRRPHSVQADWATMKNRWGQIGLSAASLTLAVTLVVFLPQLVRRLTGKKVSWAPDRRASSPR